MTLRLFNTILLSLCYSIPMFSQFVRMDPGSLQQIETYIQQEKSDEKMVGLSVGIIRDGEVVYLKGFGYEDSLNNIPASEETMYRLASVSKSVTGLMAMRLLASKSLDLSEDIRTYVPEYPIKQFGVITSEELLSNESGIIHYSGTSNGQYCQDSYNIAARDNYISSHTSEYDPIAAIDIFKDQQTCFTPGLHYQYTTWGFCLMGAVLERAASRPFEDLLYEEIVCPLGLPSLQIEFQDYRPYPNEAAGYEFAGNVIIPTPTGYTDYQDVSYKVPGGGMISSVIDLTLLMKGVVNRELLSDSLVKVFGTRHVADDLDETYYGYGTSSGIRNGDSLYWHSGSQAKTATIVYYSPENRNGVAIMSNTRGVSLFPLARLIYDYLPNVQIQGVEYDLPAQNLAKLNLQSTSYDTICEGQGYFGHTQTGTYPIVHSSKMGCDSIDTVHLTVLPLSDSYCEGVGITEQEIANLISIYPNPTNKHQITLEISDPLSPISYSIFSTSGQLVQSEEIRNRKQVIHLSGTTPGIYWIRLDYHEGPQPEIKKLVIY